MGAQGPSDGVLVVTIPHDALHTENCALLERGPIGLHPQPATENIFGVSITNQSKVYCTSVDLQLSFNALVRFAIRDIIIMTGLGRVITRRAWTISFCGSRLWDGDLESTTSFYRSLTLEHWIGCQKDAFDLLLMPGSVKLRSDLRSSYRAQKAKAMEEQI